MPANDEQFDDETLAEIRKVARNEVRTNRVYRYLVEFVVLLAVIGGLAAYQRGQDNARDELARALAAQNEVTRYEQDKKTIISQQKACERNNLGIRAPLFDFLISAIDRAKGQAALDPSTANVNLTAARAYRAEADAMVAAAALYRRFKGRPEIACKKAFELPDPPSKPIRELAKAAPSLS